MEKQKCLEDRLADLSKKLEDSVSKKEVHVDIQMNFSPCYCNIIISLKRLKERMKSLWKNKVKRLRYS